MCIRDSINAEYMGESRKMIRTYDLVLKNDFMVLCENRRKLKSWFTVLNGIQNRIKADEEDSTKDNSMIKSKGSSQREGHRVDLKRATMMMMSHDTNKTSMMSVSLMKKKEARSESSSSWVPGDEDKLMVREKMMTAEPFLTPFQSPLQKALKEPVSTAKRRLSPEKMTSVIQPVPFKARKSLPRPSMTSKDIIMTYPSASSKYSLDLTKLLQPTESTSMTTRADLNTTKDVTLTDRQLSNMPSSINTPLPRLNSTTDER
eukprot:TRINITY_DN16571_c0_g1_i1.p1 TRINITY_DN16571_c0_g1~~TRINITY_DN16571_c0_g1_i1.p1  ORF type:complete len:299 (-),score=85.03 TRINITY_DN16571_c0_g1_i1:400-1179(-)